MTWVVSLAAMASAVWLIGKVPPNYPDTPNDQAAPLEGPTRAGALQRLPLT